MFCDDCAFVCPDKELFRQFKRSIAPKNPSKTCPSCRKVFSSARNRNNHASKCNVSVRFSDAWFKIRDDGHLIYIVKPRPNLEDGNYLKEVDRVISEDIDIFNTGQIRMLRTIPGHAFKPFKMTLTEFHDRMIAILLNDAHVLISIDASKESLAKVRGSYEDYMEVITKIADTSIHGKLLDRKKSSVSRCSQEAERFLAMLYDQVK